MWRLWVTGGESGSSISSNTPLASHFLNWVSSATSSTRFDSAAENLLTTMGRHATRAYSGRVSLDLVNSNIAWPNFSCGNSR